MANFRAPGVYITERDLSEVVQPAGTSVGASVGPAYSGPTNRRVLVTSNQDFVQTFGTPISGAASEYHYYAALEFLKESGFMWYTRVTGASDTVGSVVITSAAAALTGTTVAEGATSAMMTDAEYADGNKSDKYYAIEKQTTQQLIIGALGPGDFSQNIGISIVTSGDETTTSASEFGYNIANKYPSDYPYYKINVYNKPSTATSGDAGWSAATSAISASTAPAPVETFVVSNSPLAKDYSGNSMYVKDVINGVSQYIYVNTNNAALSGGYATYGIVPLGTGVYTFDHAGTANGWEWLYSSREAVQPNILIGSYNPASSATQEATAINKVVSIANTRRDCIAVIPVGTQNQAPTAIVAAKESIAGNNSSYVAIYTGWDLIADNYSAKKIYVPKSTFAAELLARTDRVANTWDAPAGLSRGTLPSVGQYRIFNESEIGYMYNYNINTSKRIRGVGDIMWGQKTGQVKTTALDRINVRRLLLFIENTIEPSLQNYLFEPNNERTRSRVQSNISSFLQTIYAGGGVTNYQVVCDTTNNTAQVIDNNELAVDLYITPTKTIEFINVRVTITRTGVNFAEII